MLWWLPVAVGFVSIAHRQVHKLSGRRPLLEGLEDAAKKPNRTKFEQANPWADPSRVKNRVVETKESEQLRKRLEFLDKKLDAAAKDIVRQLNSSKYAVVDDVYGTEMCASMRAEARQLYEKGGMASAQSTRWDPTRAEVEVYKKQSVYSTQIEGGPDKYKLAPKLTEHVVKVTERLTKAVNGAWPDMLNTKMQTNKLAVCVGDGAEYHTHYDNSGGDDLRKLTVLYYLNPDWREELAGEFRLYGALPEAEITDIAPQGDRMLVFWSDDLIHGVLPNHCPTIDDHRYALTVWLLAQNATSIAKIDPDVEAHFFPECQDAGLPDAPRVIAG